MTAKADTKRLKEILDNVLSTAIKYSGKGKEVIISVEEKGNQVELTVKDNGLGIRDEDKEHLFEKFWRAKEEHDVDGTGLGLFIVRQLVRMMGGSVEIDSTYGEGTIVTIMLDKP